MRPYEGDNKSPFKQGFSGDYTPNDSNSGNPCTDQLLVSCALHIKQVINFHSLESLLLTDFLPDFTQWFLPWFPAFICNAQLWRQTQQPLPANNAINWKLALVSPGSKDGQYLAKMLGPRAKSLTMALACPHSIKGDPDQTSLFSGSKLKLSLYASWKDQYLHRVIKVPIQPTGTLILSL